MDQQQYDEYGSFPNPNEYYAPVDDGPSANGDLEYAAEYWRLDEEARVCFYDLVPDAFGESAPLGDLDELCRRMGRPIRDDGEQLRLMVELDTTNQMLILRHDFVSWLARDALLERELENARLFERENRVVPVAEPVWEEVVLRSQPSAEDLSALSPVARLSPEPSTFFYNVVTGESKWELPRFVQCLWDNVVALETKRALAQSVTGKDASQLLLLTDEPGNSVEMLQDLHSLFTKYDDDGSGALDGTEFEDLCVAVGQPLTGSNNRESARELMREVDPFSAQEIVSWDALSHYWVTNAPFQRRTRLDDEGFTDWERVDVLHKKNLPVVFRNFNTLVERWNHPEMEQNIVNLLLKLFPSTKLDWKKKIALFFQVQFENTSGDSGGGGSLQLIRSWDLSQCARVLSQLSHPMTRKRHLEAAIQQIHTKFAGDNDTTAANVTIQALDEATVTNWFLHSIRKVEMRGWEEMVEPASGHVYYYHEVSGLTQWDPPQMESQMTSFLSKFSGGSSSSDERITRIFRHYDLDESGSISFDEFQKFYRALLGANESAVSSQAEELKIQQIFRVLDMGGDGSVSLDEFKLWWRTKLQLEEEETEDAKLEKRASQRRELCLSFLENADSLIMRSPVGAEAKTVSGEDDHSTRERLDSQLVCFESNLLPRLVAVLGKYQLKGLTYRNALKELVNDALNQEVELEDFLKWYDAFEALEREKEELEEAKAKAQAELQAQELKAAARAKENQMKAKRKLKLNKQPQQSQQNDEEARRKRIETLFKAFDANGSGFLDEKELQQLTKALGHEMDAAQVHQMMQVMDTSGDRQVNLDEFLTFWNAFQRQKSPIKATTKLSTTATTTVGPLVQGTTKHKAKGNRPSVIEASASLSVGLEMAKSRMLKFSLDDFKEALGDWKDELADKRNDRKKQQLADEKALEQKRQWSAFVPTKKRRYAHFDVTWIEPEVVECVVDIIQQITNEARLLSRPDVAQTIQKIARGYVARTLVFRMIKARFHAHVDLQTRFLYYEDSASGKVLLERPLYRASKMSMIAPFELEDCDTKLQRYEFQKKQREMRAKQRFYEANGFVNANPFALKETHGSASSQQQQSLFVPAVFYLYDVSQLVHKRLLGDIWIPLRQQKDFVLIELIATRHRRQLKQRSSDGASYLPLHYVVRYPQFPLRVVRAIVKGYSEALRERDAFGMTPLHLAFRERRSSFDLMRLLIDKPKSKPSIWETKTTRGDTPLHVSVLHRAPIELMRWVLSSNFISIDTVCSLNAHGDSPFHIAIRQFEISSSVSSLRHSKTIIHTFFKNFDAERLCSLRTKQGDLPLHLAMDAFEKAKQRHQLASSAKETTASDWIWLTRHLATLFPRALLIRKADNGLLPIHLAIKYAFPAEFVREMWEWTLEAMKKIPPSLSQTGKAKTVLDWTMIAQTRTTLLHYAMLYQPHALDLIQSILGKIPEACSMKCIPNDDLPLHLAVSATLSSSSTSLLGALDDETGRSRVVHLLCEHYVAGCQIYNRQGKLPLHLAISSNQSVDVIKILIESSPFVLTANKQERNGLRALILAASTKNPNYTVLSTLLELTPSTKITLNDARKRLVTPLYAISLRPCHHNDGVTSNQDDADAAAAHRSSVLTKFSTNFEQIEDEDAYFLEMAKSKMRRKHQCPTVEWDYQQILRLVDLNPLDEAVLQRSFLAINNKLNALVEQPSEENQNNSGVDHLEQKKLSEAAVAVVALDSELMIVRRIHQSMYEFPSNARVQVMGQGILRKLLPTAFAKAAYKAKIDPYFNL